VILIRAQEQWPDIGLAKIGSKCHREIISNQAFASRHIATTPRSRKQILKFEQD